MMLAHIYLSCMSRNILYQTTNFFIVVTLLLNICIIIRINYSSHSQRNEKTPKYIVVNYKHPLNTEIVFIFWAHLFLELHVYTFLNLAFICLLHISPK